MPASDRPSKSSKGSGSKGSGSKGSGSRDSGKPKKSGARSGAKSGAKPGAKFGKPGKFSKSSASSPFKARRGKAGKQDEKKGDRNSGQQTRQAGDRKSDLSEREAFERRFKAGSRAANKKKKTSHRTRKRFGQHWLKDDRILNEIVAAAHLTPDDRVLEIGPGQGVLPQRLLDLAASVVAVELDRDLCKPLVAKFGDLDNFLLFQGDFLAIDVDALTAEFADRFHRQTKVVANIPYNITGPILEKLLGRIDRPNPRPFQEIVLLVQREVADRVCASADTKAFGALSVRVQYLADCELVCAVPASAFKPPPKVESAVIRLVPRPIAVPATNPKHLASLVKVGFANKRKMLRNNLVSIVDRELLLATFEQLGIDSQIRAEDLSTETWVALSNALVAAEVAEPSEPEAT